MTTRARKPVKIYKVFYKTDEYETGYGCTELQAGSWKQAKKLTAKPGREILKIYENARLVWSA